MMVIRSERTALIALMGVALLAAAAGVQAQNGTLEQTFELEPGWNAIHVRVEPVDNDIETIFSGVPVASVWRWLPDEAGKEFVQNPSEGLENIDGWFAWFPEPRPEAFLSNLFRIDANTSYLVHIDGSQSHQVVIEGRPEYRPVVWQSDAFTLTGLAVAETNPPTFAEYFSASPAHQGQPVYRLDSDGNWQLVNGTDTPIRAGEAYWIYTEGNSRYQGRMRLVLDQGESLEFSAALNEISMVLRNQSGMEGSFTLTRLNGNTMPLAYLNEDPETGEIGWPYLQDSLVVEAPPDEDVFVNLSVLREEFSSSRMEQVFSITNEHGERILLHAGGNTIQPLIDAVPGRGSDGNAPQGTQDVVSYAGLWVGEVSINAVSQSQTGGVEPVPTKKAFGQRVLIHVDSTGQARLLKDVIQMWDEGTMVPSDENPDYDEVDEPGRYVLLTDKNLISLYTGAVNRGGRQVGLRYSTIAYDFPGDTLEFTGEFEPGEQMDTTIVIEPDLPTNPYLHRYHPDHDNLDPQFLNYRQESYQVVRDMRFIFTEEDPLGRNPPGYGSTIVGGLFEGSLSGLHKNTIFTSGQFRLRRISAVPVLNQ